MKDWRPVPGLEHLFSASSDGRIRSTRTGRVLRHHVGATGYAMIATRVGGRNGKAECYRVHRLVAAAWVPGRTSERAIVHHVNGHKLDNRASNLEWVSASENTARAYEDGLIVQPVGEARVHTKLTAEAVSRLRRRYHGRPIRNARQVAARYGVDHSTLYQAVRGKTWKHLPMPEAQA